MTGKDLGATVSEHHSGVPQENVTEKKRKLDEEHVVESEVKTNGTENGACDVKRKKIDGNQNDVNKEELLLRRQELIARATQIHYPHNPLYIARGKGQYLYDENERQYLDLMNNVAHVGHCHPHVVKAGQDQMSILSTNSRFLNDLIVKLAEKLRKTLPDSLNTFFFVNSGTEANDLAIRLAATYTNHKDVVVLDGAYHGHSQSVIEISPYKFKKLHQVGQQDHIHMLDMPDSYRGVHRGDNNDPAISDAYAADAIKLMDDAVSKGREIGMFIAESMMSCGGQIIFPPGYLKKIYEHVHKLGGICVADEVQVGFGRIGKSGYWAFELQGVTPDIVTIGKPFGNGHPVSCVITTKEIAQAFEDTKVAYFNTFGGNPVSMAIATSVMEVIENENLQENAEIVGKYVVDELLKQKEKHDLIGDIRGVGLFVGIELVSDRTSRDPATEKAKQIADGLRERGILISRDGPYNNVLKIKPPMVITKVDMDHFISQLDLVLTEVEK